MMFHPKPNEKGQLVWLSSPHNHSDLESWKNSNQTAIAIPNCHLPNHLSGVETSPWLNPPKTIQQWEDLATEMPLIEPPFDPPTSLKAAAGGVVIEPDNRVWLVAPSNAYGGYKATLPKGRIDGLTPKAAALKEIFEETGLKVSLTGHLIDLPRSTTYTRYYICQRTGGSPSEMGWESQAVLLVPAKDLFNHLDGKIDSALITAIQDFTHKRI